DFFWPFYDERYAVSAFKSLRFPPAEGGIGQVPVNVSISFDPSPAVFGDIDGTIVAGENDHGVIAYSQFKKLIQELTDMVVKFHNKVSISAGIAFPVEFLIGYNRIMGAG